ncbi:hypothetical protein WA1_24085 [Scytonema hofmannii PCC 7110]|uniref:Uncharacterized protein n=1 Tax=Scytonema hofmannii PCC 7110 TaxID=128403 RepID=A0A139X7X0_9CYAN|nr:hypothetical protein WA1_24085 [Scytonema hofmannii PCC 7110]USN26959.1 hypothetical protein [synthetic construct]
MVGYYKGVKVKNLCGCDRSLDERNITYNSKSVLSVSVKWPLSVEQGGLKRIDRDSRPILYVIAWALLMNANRSELLKIAFSCGG